MQNVSFLRWIGPGLVFVAATVFAGCSPSYSEEELGTMVYEVPDVPGSDETFPMPDLDTEAKKEVEQSRRSLDPEAVD